MDPYIQSLLSQYQSRLNPQPQKTPQQIADDQKSNAYNQWIATNEGASALSDVQVKFESWYNLKHPDPSKEVSELKVMMATMFEQNQSMAKQIENLTNQLK